MGEPPGILSQSSIAWNDAVTAELAEALERLERQHGA